VRSGRSCSFSSSSSSSILGVWRILERKPYVKNRGLKPTCRTKVEDDDEARAPIPSNCCALS
jgi:hypothetical protein